MGFSLVIRASEWSIKDARDSWEWQAAAAMLQANLATAPLALMPVLANAAYATRTGEAASGGAAARELTKEQMVQTMARQLAESSDAPPPSAAFG